MSRVSSALEALRDAIHRHPWWTDSLLALLLTFISIGSVIFGGNRHQAHAIAVLDAMLVAFTTLPIALRRYRPLAVLAITVSAETVLLLFSTQTPRSRPSPWSAKRRQDAYLSSVLRKLGLRDRVQAVILAYETGLVRLGSALD